MAMLPDQGPVAAFSATAAQAGTPTSSTRRRRVTPTGRSPRTRGALATVARRRRSRRWSRRLRHRGSDTTTLTVTDDSGCSTAFVFTGETATCNGGPQAQVPTRRRSCDLLLRRRPRRKLTYRQRFHRFVSQNPSRRKVHLRGQASGSGAVDVHETAWNENLAMPRSGWRRAAPLRIRRTHESARRATTLHLEVRPNLRGKRLVRHHTYPVTLRMWVTYTPTGGRPRSIGFHGLRLPR